jgi:predicted nucleic acid-binding protein
MTKRSRPGSSAPCQMLKLVAAGHVCDWLAQPLVRVPQPGKQFADLFLDSLRALGAAGNLTTDAQLAALAIEHQAELHSADVDFSRFRGLRWRNPLTRRGAPET